MPALQSLIPTVLEESARGERAFDIYSMLLRERIVFLGQEVDDQIANLIIPQMLYLEAQEPEKDISLYINSPGGMAYAGMAIYDVIQHVRPDVSTSASAWGCRRRPWCCAVVLRASAWPSERPHHDPSGKRPAPGVPRATWRSSCGGARHSPGAWRRSSPTTAAGRSTRWPATSTVTTS